MNSVVLFSEFLFVSFVMLVLCGYVIVMLLMVGCVDIFVNLGFFVCGFVNWFMMDICLVFGRLVGRWLLNLCERV